MSNGDSAPLNLRLALVTETYPPEINGVANTLQRMAEGLRLRGHSLHLVRPAQSGENRHEDQDEDVLTFGLPIPGYRGLQFGMPAPGRLVQHWQRWQPDLVYIATEGPLGVSALRSALRLRIPTASGFHTNFDQYSGHYRMGVLKQIVRRHLQRFHNQCGVTLVPTQAQAEELGEAGFERVRTWARGVDAELFNPQRRSAELRREWGLEEDQLAVLYVGRLAPEKNLQLALKAYEAIRAEHPDSRFVLVGDGPGMAGVRKRCPHCVLVGAKRGEELARHYASGDLFLFPSLTETFGNVVLEAMASELTIVSYQVAAAAEHLREGHNALLAPEGDESAFIAQSLAAARLAAERRLARQAREDAEQLVWPKLIERLELILQQTINDHPMRQIQQDILSSTD